MHLHRWDTERVVGRDFTERRCRRCGRTELRRIRKGWRRRRIAKAG